jgi:hypothetical protein
MTQPTPEEKFGMHLKYEQKAAGGSRMNRQAAEVVAPRIPEDGPRDGLLVVEGGGWGRGLLPSPA